MRFREIKVKEIKDEKDKEKEEGYKKIKPETNITYKEACDFWDAEFRRIAQENNK